MKEETVKLVTKAAILTPAAVLAAAVVVHTGVDGTACLKETMERCPATDLLTPEQDTPVENGGGGSIPLSG